MTTRFQLRVRPPLGWRALPRNESDLIGWAQELFDELDVLPVLRRASFGSILASHRWTAKRDADSGWILLDAGQTGFVRASSRLSVVARGERDARWIDDSLDGKNSDLRLARRRAVDGGEIVERARAVTASTPTGTDVLQSRYLGFYVPDASPWIVQLEIGTSDATLYDTIVATGAAVLETAKLEVK